MSRQVQQLTFNTFAGGIITEASPLTFPEQASIAEQNFELTKQGYRRRRLGLDLTTSTPEFDGLVSAENITTHLWRTTGGQEEEFFVMSVNHTLYIYDVTNYKVGERLVYVKDLRAGQSVSINKTSITSRQDKLIIAMGASFIHVVTSTGNATFASETQRLTVRDRESVAAYRYATSIGKDLRSAEDATKRLSNAECMMQGNAAYSGAGGDWSNTPETIAVTGREKLKDGILTADGGERLTEWGLTFKDKSFRGIPVVQIIVRQFEEVANASNKRYTGSIYFQGQPNCKRLTVVIGANSSVAAMDTKQGTLGHFTLGQTSYDQVVAGVVKEVRIDADIYGQSPHIYNLWNQGWGVPRMKAKAGEDIESPLITLAKEEGYIPASSDSVLSVLHPDTSVEVNRTADRFHPKDLTANPGGSFAAPYGRYIIDALDRGGSRQEAFNRDIKANDSARPLILNDQEQTTGGCTTVGSYASRIWYAGFTGDTYGSTLPMSNKVLYSQLGEKGVSACYQEADPTSKDAPDSLSTDGGYVTIQGMDTVVKLIETDTSLLVFATNGVWAIAGDDGNAFTPLTQAVTKVNTKGCASPNSIVQIDNIIYYWSDDGIYQIQATGFASFQLASISKETINDLIITQSAEDLAGVSGVYDDRLEQIIWTMDTRGGSIKRRELIYHRLINSYTINAYNSLTRNNKDGKLVDTSVIGVAQVPVFSPDKKAIRVFAGDDTVMAGTDQVVTDEATNTGIRTRVTRLVLSTASDGSGVSNIEFGTLTNTDFLDYGIIDAEAFMLTGYVTGGDTMRYKDVPWLVTHLRKTEGVITDVGVTDESSCYCQAQWNWTSDPAAQMWGSPIQVYRLLRGRWGFTGDTVAKGTEVVTSKTKLRGRGRTVSLKFYTEPGKDCQLLGWNILAGITANV